MIASKNNKINSSHLSSYAIRATKAMVDAQKEAAKENARFGLPLIVVNHRKSLKSKNKK